MRDEEALRRRIATLEEELNALRVFEHAPYRSVVEDMSELVVRWKPDGTRLFVNDAYCRMFGASRNELLGTSFWSLIREEDRTRVRERLAALTPAAPVSSGRHRAIDPKGETFWMEWVDRASFDDAGNVLEMQSVGRDITERVRLEQHSRHVENADAVARLSAGIAHDLNNMLTVLSYQIELLKMRVGACEELDVAAQALRSVVDLVDQLGALRVGVVFRPAVIDLNARIHRLLTLLEEVSGDQVVVSATLAKNPCPILGDPTQIDQVLFNLVKNAAQAMASGGTTTLTTRSGETRIFLEVSDTGSGIDPELLPRIFDASVTTKVTGQGLGLATVKTIVESHGGTIDVDSSPGGTTFRIDLPRAEGP
jgi:PAS domain S-box-containing protein